MKNVALTKAIADLSKALKAAQDGDAEKALFISIRSHRWLSQARRVIARNNRRTTTERI